MSQPSKSSQAPLPPDVTSADVAWPDRAKSEPREWVALYERLRGAGLEDYHTGLQFYLVGGRTGAGWVLTTLKIGGAGRGTTERFYGIGVSDEKVYRVGRGPHVLREVTVHLSPANVDRLWRYVELYRKGLAAAGQIRDRISSRRAQGQLYRDQGRTSWRWDS
jgi:hypothetical protein